MKKPFIVLVCLSVLFALVSCSTTSVGKNYQIPSDSDFAASPLWDMDYYVDKFLKDTDVPFIRTYATSGTFVNSVVSAGSECTARLLINQKGEVEVYIDEYGRYPVKSGISDWDWIYKYRFSNSKGDTIVEGTAYLYSNRFSFNKNASAEIINAFCHGGEYIMVLTGGGYITSTYKLKFKGSGCANILRQFFPVAETKNGEILYL